MFGDVCMCLCRMDIEAENYNGSAAETVSVAEVLVWFAVRLKISGDIFWAVISIISVYYICALYEI